MQADDGTIIDNNSNSNSNDSIASQSASDADCQLAKQIVLDPYAQFARILLLLFNSVPTFLIPLLVVEYKRTRLALHRNLKVTLAIKFKF
jgi:hypothetical protein